MYKRQMSTNAQLVAEDIASQLERRIAFRRATKMAMRNAMSPRRGSGAVAAKGIKIQIGGRLNEMCIRDRVSSLSARWRRDC